MAPPPSPELPVFQRFLKLAQTLQFGWFVGHLTLIVCIARYLLSWISMNYYSTMARYSYRLAFISAAVTYGIVVYKSRRARQKTKAREPSVAGYLGDENIQYLLMAIVWLWMPQYSIAMLPYGIYSVFHVATYLRTNIIPTLVAPVRKADAAPGAGKLQQQQSPAAESIGNFVKKYYDQSMSIVAGLEILLWFRVLFATILNMRGLWILFVLYTAFLRGRFAQSMHVQSAFTQLEARVDNYVGNQGTPPLIRQGWEGIKNGVRQFHSLTDLQKYSKGATAPKKAE